MKILDAIHGTRRALKGVLLNASGAKERDRSLNSAVIACPERRGIALVAIIKDEAHYICEWIAFHANLGVRSIYVYDNGSTDGTADLIMDCSFPVHVRVIPWANFGRHIRIQTAAYNHAVANFGRRYRWITFLDIDEFVFPRFGGDLNEAMAVYEGLPAVSLPWQMFGPSGHKRRPNALVIDAYRERAGFPDAESSLLNYKTIADPTAVKWAHTHYCELWNHQGAMFNDAGRRFWRSDRFNPAHATAERIQLNHYFTRSYEEFEQKISKGRVSKEGRLDNRSVLQLKMNRIVSKTVRDDSAARFVPAVRAVLAAAGGECR